VRDSLFVSNFVNTSTVPICFVCVCLFVFVCLCFFSFVRLPFFFIWPMLPFQLFYSLLLVMQGKSFCLSFVFPFFTDVLIIYFMLLLIMFVFIMTFSFLLCLLFSFRVSFDLLLFCRQTMQKDGRYMEL